MATTAFMLRSPLQVDFFSPLHFFFNRTLIDLWIILSQNQVFKVLLDLKDVNSACGLHEDNFWSQAEVWLEIPGPREKKKKKLSAGLSPHFISTVSALRNIS